MCQLNGLLDIEILLISEEDGRESLVDLTRTLCEMAQRGKISVDDVTQDLIDTEVSGMHSSSIFAWISLLTLKKCRHTHDRARPTDCFHTYGSFKRIPAMAD